MGGQETNGLSITGVGNRWVISSSFFVVCPVDFVILQDSSVKSRDFCHSLKSYFHVTVNRVSYHTLFIGYCLGVVSTCL